MLDRLETASGSRRMASAASRHRRSQVPTLADITGFSSHRPSRQSGGWSSSRNYEETVVINDARYDMSANHYPETVHPRGFEHLKAFTLDPLPRFIYEVGGVEIEKTVFMVHGENTTVIQYTASFPCTLELRPLAAFRDYHNLTHSNNAINPAYIASAEYVVFSHMMAYPPYISRTQAMPSSLPGTGTTTSSMLPSTTGVSIFGRTFLTRVCYALSLRPDEQQAS